MLWFLLFPLLSLLNFTAVAYAQGPSPVIAAHAVTTLSLHGNLLYLPALALPQDAKLLLTLNTFSEQPSLLQSQTQSLSTQLPPLPFAWTLILAPSLPNVALFQVAIISANRIIWQSETIPLVLMPGTQHLEDLQLMAYNRGALEITLYCKNQRFLLFYQNTQQQLRHEQRTVNLQPLPSATGRRFAFDNQYELWKINGNYFLQTASQRELCISSTQLPALKLADQDLKLEIFQQDFLLSLAEKALYLSPIQRIKRLDNGLLFHSELFDLWYKNQTCPKTSAWQQRQSLRLVFNNEGLAKKLGKEKTFCYGDFYPHGRWQVQTLYQQELAPGTITLSFLDEAALAVTACNNFSITFSLEKEKITFLPPIRTSDACQSASQEQEQRLLQVLSTAERLVRGENNQLELWAGDLLLLIAKAEILPAGLEEN